MLKFDYIAVAILFIVQFSLLNAQNFPGDSVIHKEIEEMVITATRSERLLSNVTVPAILVNAKSIQMSGSIRLNEILQEQTGLLLTSGTGSSAVGGGVFGNGIQIQGMAPDYTLIMLDGEPLIGRQGGIIDLSRFTAGNIRKIEVIKGPSSALYGSEAMGGVVNIITEQRRDKLFTAGLRFGSYLTTDIYSSMNLDNKRSTLYLFANYNASQGYDLEKNSPEKTIDPYFNTAFQLKFTHRFTEKTRLSWNNRIFYGIQTSNFAINGDEINISGHGRTVDLNINPVLTHLFSPQWKASLKAYGSLYNYIQNLNHINSSEPYYADDFRHYYFRLEQQTDWEPSLNQHFIGGGGYNVQIVETSRYRTRQLQYIAYLFIQHEWISGRSWTVIPGLRYDINSAYSNKLSPKISAQYKVNSRQKINLSYGSGFKSPDFRQLYLYYVNPAAQGYRVYGANEFSVKELEKELIDGLISQILPDAYRIIELRPEVSHGFNLGTSLEYKSIPLNLDINIFYNNVKDLINYIPVAYTDNNSIVFSYLNVKKAFTGGTELNVRGQIKGIFEWSAGYQLLLSGDQDIVGKIQRKEVYGRDIPQGPSRRMTIWDYSGLLGRSPHLFNLKLSYSEIKSGFGASIRLIYRSRWGVTDLDGNGFANMKDEFAKGYMMVNASIQKSVFKNIIAQISVNNILNQTDAINVPQNPGISIVGSVHWNFLNN
jgi:outer membrane receptor for ferrienterochelin and colicins